MMRSKTILLPAVLSAILCAVAAYAQEKPGIPVSPGGDIGAAIGRAGRGGTVILEGGTYAMSGMLSIGPSASGVTIKSKDGERAVLDFQKRGNIYFKGDGVTLKNIGIINSKGFGVDVDASHVTLDGCKILGSDDDAVKLSPGNWSNRAWNKGATLVNCEIGQNAGFEGVDCVAHDDVKIINCYIHECQGWGTYLKGGASRGLIDGCFYYKCGYKQGDEKGGVCLGEATGPPEIMTYKFNGKAYENADSVVRNCVFVDMASAALAAWGALRPVFYNNTCIDVAKQDRAAFIVLASREKTKDLVFVNNILVSPGRPMIWFYPGGFEGTATIDNNCYWGGNANFWNQNAGDGQIPFGAWQSKYGYDKNSVFADPMVDKTWHLTPKSPCVDKGQPVKGLVTDIDGGQRMGKVDIGADEYNSGKPLALPPPALADGTGIRTTVKK